MKNVAVFGAGRIGRIHAANLAALPGVTLKYVCDPMGDAAACCEPIDLENRACAGAAIAELKARSDAVQAFIRDYLAD